ADRSATAPWMKKASSMADAPGPAASAAKKSHRAEEGATDMEPYEPFSEAVREDPYPYYAALRDEAPVYWAEGAQAWGVSRYDDVLFAFRNAELFSSHAMRTMLMGARVNTLEERGVWGCRMAVQQAQAFALERLMVGRNLLTEDRRRHPAMRNIVNRGFTARRIAMWEQRVREFTRAYVKEMRDAEE